MGRKIVDVPARLIQEIVRPGVKVIIPEKDGSVTEFGFDSLPEGTKAIAVHGDFFRNCISVMMEHDSFREPNPGEEAERIYLQAWGETVPLPSVVVANE